MQPLRLLLVDDHALFRDGLISLLSYQDDFTVVGEAEDAEIALAQARALEPDIVLMDIELPGEDGVSATRRLKMEMPAVTVVMLTVHDDSHTLFEAIKAGAHGYLVKNVRSRELLEQLRGLARGEAAISRRMAARILEEIRGQTEPFGPEEELTARELDVLDLVAVAAAVHEPLSTGQGFIYFRTGREIGSGLTAECRREGQPSEISVEH